MSGNSGRRITRWPPSRHGGVAVEVAEHLIEEKLEASRSGGPYTTLADSTEKLSAVATVTGDEVQIAQRLTPNPDAPAACVAGDALPVVVVHLAKPLEDELVRVTVMP